MQWFAGTMKFNMIIVNRKFLIATRFKYCLVKLSCKKSSLCNNLPGVFLSWLLVTTNNNHRNLHNLSAKKKKFHFRLLFWILELNHHTALLLQSPAFLSFLFQSTPTHVYLCIYKLFREMYIYIYMYIFEAWWFSVSF